jgi:hypothetical protein
VDLSAYAGQRLGASTLRAATADIMADITALLAKIRQETPPAVPYDPAVAALAPLGASDPSGGTSSGSGSGAQDSGSLDSGSGSGDSGSGDSGSGEA